MKNRVILSIAIALCLAPIAHSQTVSAGFTYYEIDNSGYPSGEFNHLGWSPNGSFLAFDTAFNGAGATDRRGWFGINVATNSISSSFQEDVGVPPSLVTQSASWMTAKNISAPGYLKAGFTGSYFVSGQYAPLSSLKTTANFSVLVNGVTRSYSIRLLQDSNGPWENSPDAIPGYRRAKFKLQIRRGNSAWKNIQVDSSYTRRVLMYGIDKVYVSPNKKFVAVYLAKYSGRWYEGWNLAIERMVATRLLP